jgi:hypothetical protein
MAFSVLALRAPADSLQNLTRRIVSPLLARVFRTQPPCKHPSPSFPKAGIQNCEICGAWRDYHFSERWHEEHALLLHDYKSGYLSRDQFAGIVHTRLVNANAVFVGEWRKGGR